MIEFIIFIIGVGIAVFAEQNKKKKKVNTTKNNQKNAYKKANSKKKKVVNDKNNNTLRSDSNKKKTNIFLEENLEKKLIDIDLVDEEKPKVEILSEYKTEFSKNPKKAFIFSEIFNRKY